MSRTFKDSDKRTGKLTKKARRTLEKLNEQKAADRFKIIMPQEFKSSYKKLKIEE